MSVLTDVLWCTWWSDVYSGELGGQLCGTKAYLAKEWSTHARPQDAVLALGLDYLSHECVPTSSSLSLVVFECQLHLHSLPC